MKYLALKLKGSFKFTCVSKDEVDFEKKINKSFYDWKGIQPKGKGSTIEDYLSSFDKVVVEITPLALTSNKG